jgi:DNA replication protein DnaC
MKKICESDEIGAVEAGRKVDVLRAWKSSGVFLGNDESRHSIMAREGPDWERNPTWTEKFKSFRDYQRGRMVMLAGKRGTGKTQLSICLAWSWMHQPNGPRTFLYAVADKIIRQIQEAIGDGAKSAVMERFAKADLLVIDEEDRRARSESADRTFVELFDARYQFRKTTIIVSNRATQDEIQTAVGESIFSRLGEVGGVAWCRWDGFR